MSDALLAAAVRRIETLWIPLPDGTRLSARIWLPAEAEQAPVPAVLEYIPYRKGDATAGRDHKLHGALAARGYACVRVDLRGSGESEGLMGDEYCEQEQLDGVAVIEWLAAQPWCSGAVATIGISWGGVIGLLLAARRPPALKTIVVAGAVDDRYYDDAGYYMGCLNGETLGWGAYMYGLNARPPDPAVAGEGWRAQWLARLEETPPFLERWLAHQRRDDYWRFASLAEDHGAIEVPVLAVSGWTDCWPNTVPRLLEKLDAPVRGIMGPWAHVYPHDARPGPGLDFIGELDRWFARTLKDGSLPDDLGYLAYLQDGVAPRSFYHERPGGWLKEPGWPSPNVTRRRLVLSAAGLDRAGGAAARLTVSSPQTVGLHSGEYMPVFRSGAAPQLPDDQRWEDIGSLTFDGAALDQDLAILGDPKLHLRVAADKPLALVAARLCDVAPDGASTLITRGLLNLAQRDGRETPVALTPGEMTDVQVVLNHIGYRVPAGHRLRLALSTSYWPMAWPSPERATLTVDTAGSALDLPLHGRPEAAVSLPPAPDQTPDDSQQSLAPARSSRHIATDCASGRATLVIEDDSGLIRLAPSGLEFGVKGTQRFSVHPDDPLSAEAHYLWTWRYQRGDWRTEVVAETTIRSTAEDFLLACRLTAREGGEVLFESERATTWPRDHF